MLFLPLLYSHGETLVAAPTATVHIEAVVVVAVVPGDGGFRGRFTDTTSAGNPNTAAGRPHHHLLPAPGRQQTHPRIVRPTAHS